MSARSGEREAELHEQKWKNKWGSNNAWKEKENKRVREGGNNWKELSEYLEQEKEGSADKLDKLGLFYFYFYFSIECLMNSLPCGCYFKLMCC